MKRNERITAIVITVEVTEYAGGKTKNRVEKKIGKFEASIPEAILKWLEDELRRNGNA